MPVSHAKPADERAGHRGAPVELTGAGRVAPPLPRQLSKLPAELVEQWHGIWTSPVAAVLDPVSDLEPMTRLFRLYHLQCKMFGALEQHIEWLEDAREDVEFDPGWARNALGFASEIRQLEQTLGITPRGRLVIGAAVVAAGKAAAANSGGDRDDAED
jgi:hypothetical protein